MVSESELIERLREFLRNSDLNTTTTSTVRRQLESDFGIDLSDRKSFIREQVDLFLQTVQQDDEPQNDAVEEEDSDDKPEQSQEGSDEEDDDNEEEEKPKRTRGSVKKTKNKKKERLVSFFFFVFFCLLIIIIPSNLFRLKKLHFDFA